ncbi:MAG: hypothetical protein RLZZ337_1011 [Bacteroidota bacterium]|jgi:hydroxymethylglutaryl-CoA reductase (NADPH)
MKTNYEQTPGRGLMNQTAYDLRMKYLNTLVDHLQDTLQSNSIHLSQVQNNIESFIGTIEIPLGHVGPLLFLNENEEPEWVHTAVGTTEGALVASMNRGAKAISQSGGFKAHIVHQKMLRTPMFTFDTMANAIAFDHWIKAHFNEIKEVTKNHSNHADLLEITSIIIGKIVHLKFIYNTSDASGQNMTTGCTWNACLWIDDQFEKQTNIEIAHFVIDGNGASDKKVSYYAMQNGRGIHVISECFLSNEVIEKTLRTNADDMFRSFNHSAAISRLDGMIGYNINVANAIAGIFASTGQDLASIHESSTGILQMEQTAEGLYLSLSLPNLVVGTVGGGTHLPVATAILNLMKCKGGGKIKRFAKLIAGFSLSIEISTLAAIVSGQFARSHQKLGRNKPISWLLRSEVTPDFVKSNMPYCDSEIEEIHFNNEHKLDNGILTQLTNKVSKKLIGFIQADVITTDKEKLSVLVKSKALGDEVLDGLHFMASNVSVDLADKLLSYKEKLEYGQSNETEITVYEALHKLSYVNMPKLYGSLVNKDREIYLLFTERLLAENLHLFNSEDYPEKWTWKEQEACIRAIHLVHSAFPSNTEQLKVNSFNPLEAIELYHTFIAVNRKDYDYLEMEGRFLQMADWLADWETNGINYHTNLCLVHNDFNPRNIAIRKDGKPCFYDWELAFYSAPQRDIFEFLAFVLNDDFEDNDLRKPMQFHYECMSEMNDDAYGFSQYIADFITAGRVFIVTRVNFYLSGSTLVNYSFIERVFRISNAMLDKANKWLANAD